MASSHRDPADAGFATPAASAISLAIALVVSGVTGLSLSTLRAQEEDQTRLRAELALQGAQDEAALMLMQASNQGPTRWELTEDGRHVEVVAEPEAMKISLQTAAMLSDSDLARWRVASPDALRARLATLATDRVQVTNDVPDADSSRTWSLCARSAISAYGAAQLAPAVEPSGLVTGTAARVGQLWRVRVASDGWVDDRVIRFTGARAHPLNVAADRFARGSEMGEACATFASNAAP